jgi:hypothetical protein
MGALNGHHEMKYDNGDQYVGDFVDGTGRRCVPLARFFCCDCFNFFFSTFYTACDCVDLNWSSIAML